MRTTIDTLESASRRDRRKMRDLEHELAKLEDKLRTQRRSDADESSAVPHLPVEVLEPDAQASVGETFDGDYEVVGFDEEGVEIVYVGDAAQDKSVRPKSSYLRTPSPGVRSAGSKTQRSARADIKPFTERPNERLAVTESVGPTVERQLASIRSQARRTTAASRPRPMTITPSVPTQPSSTERRAAEGQAKRATASEEHIRAQYNRYYQALRARNHEFAVTGFRNFIERYPEHDFADNARYWLAEAFYDQREYNIALREFSRVRTEHPTGNKVPAAMLKAAYCHIALGDIAKGRYLLLELIEDYPNSKPATLAGQRLETLGEN